MIDHCLFLNYNKNDNFSHPLYSLSFNLIKIALKRLGCKDPSCNKSSSHPKNCYI